MKKFLLLLLSLSVASAAWCGGYDKLTVHLTDGSTVDITLADELALSFTADNLVATNGTDEVSVARADISHFSHSVSSGLSTPELGAGFVRQGNSLVFSGLGAGTLTVHNVAGIEVLSEAVEGDYTLSLDGLAAGVYVVTVNNISYKVAVK